jgi:hypothetical protein
VQNLDPVPESLDRVILIINSEAQNSSEQEKNRIVAPVRLSFRV